MTTCYRSISSVETNKEIVRNFRAVMETEFLKTTGREEIFFGRKNRFTYVLPCLASLPQPQGNEAFTQLLDNGVMTNLEQTKVLNWWVDKGIEEKMYVLHTAGAGNCLLHACSLAAFGIHDRWFILRRALRNIMLSSSKIAFLKTRYKRYQQFEYENCGMTVEEDNLEEEWKELYNSVDTGNHENAIEEMSKSNNIKVISMSMLEAWHVYIISYILRRPIIVLTSQEMGLMKGIYLPLDRDPKECSKNPIVISFCSSHFSACTFMNKNADYRNMHKREFYIPLVDEKNAKFPLNFNFKCVGNKLFHLDDDESLKVLESYMDICYRQTSNLETILTCKMVIRRPNLLGDLVNNFIATIK